MKSLKESLFDKDLVAKELTFGSKWELEELDGMLGDYYNWYGDSSTQRELEKKTFKSNKLVGKPMAETKPSMWKPFGGGYAEDMDYWGNFLKIVKMFQDYEWLPVYNDYKGIPKEIVDELKKYMFATGGLAVEFSLNYNHTASLRVKKSFGSRNKYITFVARFREK